MLYASDIILYRFIILYNYLMKHFAGIDAYVLPLRLSAVELHRFNNYSGHQFNHNHKAHERAISHKLFRVNLLNYY